MDEEELIDDEEELIDHCIDDLYKLVYELNVPVEIMKNLPRQEVRTVYRDLCQAYKLITDVIYKYRRKE